MKTRAPLLVAALACASSVTLAQTRPTEIVSVQGKGQYSIDQQRSWHAAAVKQTLQPTNYVRTLDLSKMAILLPDRTQMELGPNSLAQILGPDDTASIRLPSGRAWSQAKAPPKRLIIETPSALAAIRGTDWELVVDEAGRVTLSVFSGEVELYNDQGSVSVRQNEQARAEKGRAPVKLQLNVSRTRVQWVSSFTIDPDRYVEFRGAVSEELAAIARLLREQSLGEAHARLKAATSTTSGPAVAHLLLADFEVFKGESVAAKEILDRGMVRFPADERFDVALARLALLNDDPVQARARADAAVRKRPDSVDAWIALGDVERLDGRADHAVAAYSRASAASATDARAWLGLGSVESAREDFGRARSSLEKAIALDHNDAAARGELGIMEAFAGNLARGRAEIQAALAAQPDNYVALTGLGIVEMKAGNVDAAIDALLRASLVEPRYARAHLYLAAAHYQARQDDAALAELKRAAEVDPHDPLPHLLASIVHADRVEPGLAVEEARAALERIPYLKSLNQVADNQRGVANVGAPLAAMGLEAWARSAANESYLPFWGASHLFLADRYPGEFNQRSELMQGYITDPIVFGAPNRFQSLFQQPGNYATASMRYGTSDDLRLAEPVLTLNGYDVSRFPVSYFAEVVDTHVEPRNTPFHANARTYTAAVGAKPTHELGFFVYANRLSMGADLGVAGVPGGFARIHGDVSRVDAGVRFASDPRSIWWVKVGASDESSTSDDVVRIILEGQTYLQQSRFTIAPREKDAGVRYAVAVSGSLELTAGAETARQRMPITLGLDSLLHVDGFPVDQVRLDQVERDRSASAYVLARWGSAQLRLEAGAAWSDYRKDRDFHISNDGVPGADTFLAETYSRRKVEPMAGFTWRAASTLLLRSACRRWLRPTSLDTLAPIAIAGIPLDDQIVYAGGELQQCRAQAEWSAARATFATAFFERSRVRNLVSPLDGVLNTRSDVTNLNRLRNRVLTPPAKPDLLEDQPVYGEGIAKRATLGLDHVLTHAIGARLYYTYTDSENTAAAFGGLRIPYLARHQANLGITWAPGWRTLVTAQAIYRTSRYVDEANTVKLAPGWDANVRVFAESPDKRWAIEAFASNLLKKDTSDIFGIVLSYRF